jgi:hypothetical protein
MRIVWVVGYGLVVACTFMFIIWFFTGLSGIWLFIVCGVIGYGCTWMANEFADVFFRRTQ